MSTPSFKSRSCVVMLPSLRKVVKYQSSSGNYTFCFVVHTINARPSCGVPMADFCIRKRRSMVSRQFCGCLTICKTVVDLTCERLVRFWTFFDQTPYGKYVCCTITLNFYDICDFVSNLAKQCWQSLGNRTTKTSYVWCEQDLRQGRYTVGIFQEINHKVYNIFVF